MYIGAYKTGIIECFVKLAKRSIYKHLAVFFKTENKHSNLIIRSRKFLDQIQTSESKS